MDSHKANKGDKIITIDNPNIDTKVDLPTEQIGNFLCLSEMQNDEIKYFSDYLDNWRETIIGLNEHKYTPENYKNDFLSQTNKFFKLLDDKYSGSDNFNAQIAINDFRMIDCIDESYRLMALNTDKKIDFENGDTHLEFVYDANYEQFVYDLAEICNNLGSAYFPDSYNIETNKNNKESFENAVHSFESGDVESAYSVFSKIPNYSNSNTYIQYIDAVIWYEEQFPNTLDKIAHEEVKKYKDNDECFDSINNNLQKFRFSTSQLNIDDKYSELIFNALYDACVEKSNSKQYTNYYRILSLLIDNDYQVENCNKMLNEFKKKFENIAGTYVQDMQFEDSKCIVRINIDTLIMEITEILQIRTKIEDKYILDLNDTGKYKSDIYLFTFEKNKLIYGIVGSKNTIEYQLKEKDTNLLSEIDIY